MISLERLKLSIQILHTRRLYKVLAYRCQSTQKGRGQGYMAHFKFWRPQSYLRNGWIDSCQILYTCKVYQALNQTDLLKHSLSLSLLQPKAE